jgi:hypothetical protein
MMDEATRFLAEKVHRLEAEIERLRAENTSLKQFKTPNTEVFTATRNPYADEVERLRAIETAAREVADSFPVETWGIQVLRQALEERTT